MDISVAPAHLRQLTEQGMSDTSIDVVAIAGVGTTPADSWTTLTTQWPQLFQGNTVPDARVLAFEYDMTVDENFSWRSVLSLGNELLENLYDLVQDRKLRARPTLFICHSLGGLILKQALSVANQQLQKSHGLFACISGIIFLGTPHSSTDANKGLEDAMQILRATTSFNEKAFKTRLIEEAAILKGLATRFEDVRLLIPVLSAYETKKTRVRENILRSRRLILSPQSAVTTGMRLEELMELPGDHGDLCHLQGENGEPAVKLGDFVTNVIQNAQRVVEERLRTFDMQSLMNESLAHSKGSYWGDVEERKESDFDVDTGAATQDSKHTGSSFEMLPSISNIHSTPKRAKLPCFLVEPRTRNQKFFGRTSVLEQLDSELLPTDDQLVSSQLGDIGLRQFAICGLGGVGKTEIAVEWAYSRRSHFDAVFWVAADEASKLGTGFCQIALKLGLEDSSNIQNQVVSRELVKGWLANPKRTLEIGPDSDIVGQDDAKWLLIFDNAENIDALDDYWPVGGNGSLLITSRDPLAKTAHSMNASYIDLEPFTKMEGAEFLRQLTLTTNHHTNSEQIVERLGGLPLAISQMAGIMRAQYLSFSDFLERYEDDQEISELHNLSIGTGHTSNRTIASVWVFDKLSPAAQSVLKITAFLDPDCIPEKLYTEGAAKVTLDSYPRSLASLAAARAELLQASFIRRNPEKKEIWVHRLVQDSIRAKMTVAETESALDSTIQLISSLWPSVDIANRHSVKSWRQCEELYPHVIVVTNLYRQLFEKNAVKPHVGFANLLNDAGWWQHERGNSHEVKHIFELALAICRQVDGGGLDSLLGDLHHSLGAIANETNDPVGCLVHNKELFKIRQNLATQTGVRDFKYAACYAQYATALVMNNDLSLAIEMYKRAVEAIQELPDFTKPMLSVTIADLGFALWLAGDLEEASVYLVRAIKDREDAFGANDTESYRLGFLLHALGNVRWSQFRLDESFELHQKALVSYKATIGDNHHRTADVCHRVAKHYIRLDLHESAMEMIDQSLKAWLTDRRSFKQEIARTSFLKSKVCEVLGDEAGATQARETAHGLAIEITDMAKTQVVELQESDYDGMVTFWSR